MLADRTAIFISCSDTFRERVADRLKLVLADLGFYPVIVSEEPRLPGRSWEPESKVESYLRACEVFVALVTPDEQLADGTFRCRPNVTDEIARARSDPRITDQMIVVKTAGVELWSNINPTYDRLDVDNPESAIDAVVKQLAAWELVPLRRTLDTPQGSQAPADQSSGSAQPSPDETLADSVVDSKQPLHEPGPAVSVRTSIVRIPRGYPPEPLMSDAQYQAVLGSRYSFSSHNVELKITRATPSLKVGMRFKNIGPALIRWEMEAFEVTMPDRSLPTAIYLTDRGSLGVQDSMSFEGPDIRGIDLTTEITGQLAFSAMYGPAQRPRAFRTQEIWQFTLTPSGDSEFATLVYRVRDSEAECER